jgi:hypothetical protein
MCTALLYAIILSEQAQGMALGSHTLLAAEFALTYKHTTTTDMKIRIVTNMPHIAFRPAHEGLQGAGQIQACAT